jgi:predicted PurR-regulated permease PerM
VRLGRAGWLTTGIVVGAAVVTVAFCVLLPYLSPAIFAVILAAVFQPGVGWLIRHRVGPTLAAILGTATVPVLVIVLVIVATYGLRGESANWQNTAGSAAAQIRSALGTDPLTPLLDSAQSRGFLLGLAGVVVQGVAAAATLAFAALLGLYVLFFLLKDGHRLTGAISARLPVEPATGRELVDGAAVRLRRYIVGKTVVALMDAVVISLGAIILRMPLVLVIFLVTFAAAYVPYLGAWLSGIFAVVVALGSGGPTTALWMLAIVLVTQNILEGLMRPYVSAKALDMHPVTVLAVTLLGGILGGFIGVFIAPPFVAIALFWLRTVRARSSLTGEASGPAEG